MPAVARAAAVRAVAATAVARAVPVASLEPAATDGRGLVGLDGCEVRLCVVIRVPVCAPVCPVCVPHGVPAPSGVFLPVDQQESFIVLLCVVGFGWL